MKVPNAHFIGIDPGFSGAIGWIDGPGKVLGAWDLPVTGTGRKQQFDIEALNELLYRIRSRFKKPVFVGLENPTSRPGEGAHRSHRFGEGIGMLKALLVAHHISFDLISPNLWKGRLGLPGKSNKHANKAGVQMLEAHYEQASNIVRGPRGGIKDGRLDALLIAHWQRINNFDVMKWLVKS